MLDWDEGNTRHTILKAALELFAESGYRGVSTRQICDAAGVTQPTLYYHFESKEGLCNSLLEVVVKKAEESIQEALRSDLPIIDGIRRFVHARLDFVRTHKDFVKFLLEFLLGPDSSGLREWHLRKADETGHGLYRLIENGQKEGILDPGIDPNVASMALNGAINYTIGMHLHLQKLELTEDLADSITDLWLGGMTPRERMLQG